MCVLMHIVRNNLIVISVVSLESDEFEQFLIMVMVDFSKDYFFAIMKKSLRLKHVFDVNTRSTTCVTIFSLSIQFNLQLTNLIKAQNES